MNESGGWHRADIMAEVRKRGSTLAEIARKEGLARQTLYWAMSVTPRLRANKAIADFLGEPLCALWPQWFDADGKLISHKIPRNPISSRAYVSRPTRRRRAA